MKPLAALLLGLATGCAAPDAIMPSLQHQQVVSSVVVVLGDSQTGPVATPLPNPVVVRVLDDSGKPVVGQPVIWRVVSGGGTVFAGFGLTDSHGEERDLWTLGDTAGAQTLEARAVDSTGAPITFARLVAFAAPGPVTDLTLTTTDTTLFVGQPLVLGRLVRRAIDRFGNTVDSLPPLVVAPNPTLTVRGDTVTTSQELRSVIGFSVGNASARVQVAALRDLRGTRWALTYACRNDPTAMRGTEAPPIGWDSVWVRAASDSVTYASPFAPTLWYTGTVTQWWKDGKTDIAPLSASLAHLTQDVGQIGAFVLAPDSSYVGPSACPIEAIGAVTLPRLTSQPVAGIASTH